MASRTGWTNTSENRTDVIKIPTANLEFSTYSSSKKVSLGDSNSDRQPEMAAETGNTHISGTVTYTTEIQKVNLGFSTTPSSKIKKLPRAIAMTIDNRKWQCIRFGFQSCHFRLSIVVAITCLHFVEFGMTENVRFAVR